MPATTCNEPETSLTPKNVRLGKTVVFTVAFIVLGVLFTVLNANGVYLYRFGESQNMSVMFYLAFICYCGIGYSLMTLATFWRIRMSKGTDGEVSMLAKLFQVSAVIAGIIGITLC